VPELSAAVEKVGLKWSGLHHHRQQLQATPTTEVAHSGEVIAQSHCEPRLKSACDAMLLLPMGTQISGCVVVWYHATFRCQMQYAFLPVCMRCSVLPTSGLNGGCASNG